MVRQCPIINYEVCEYGIGSAGAILGRFSYFFETGAVDAYETV